MVQTSAARAGGVDRSRRSNTKSEFGGVMHKDWFRLNTVAALALSIYAIAATASLAQEWPTHPVRWVLPFGPGSGADTAARLINEKLQQNWGQPIIIDGKPGGDGLLSLQIVVSARMTTRCFSGQAASSSYNATCTRTCHSIPKPTSHRSQGSPRCRSP
jgi:hypothetical protein